MKRRKILTAAEILAAEDAPRRSGAGRPFKWTAAQIDAERAVAIKVELARIERGIPTGWNRTPSAIFKMVAAQCGTSARSARRHHQVHRQVAIKWARIVLQSPKWRKAYADLVAIFGKEIGALPTTLVDRIHIMRESAKPSELSAIDDAVRRITGQKSLKS